MPTKPAGAHTVAVARLRQIKRIVNGTQNNLQALDKIGAVAAGDAQLQDELTALATTLTDLQHRLEEARSRSMTIAAAAATRLAAHLTPGVSYTLARHGETETRST